MNILFDDRHLCEDVTDVASMLKTSFWYALPPLVRRCGALARSGLHTAPAAASWSKRMRGAVFGGMPEPKAKPGGALLAAPVRTTRVNMKLSPPFQLHTKDVTSMI